MTIPRFALKCIACQKFTSVIKDHASLHSVGIHFIAPKARSAFTFRILDRQFPMSAIPLLTLQLGVDFLLAVTLSRPAFSAPHNFL